MAWSGPGGQTALDPSTARRAGPVTMSSPAPGLQARHQAALDQGQFLIQRCQRCHRHVYFPRVVCPHCGHGTLDLVPPAGTGTVHAVTTIVRKQEAGGDYNLSLIELDEGVRLMSRVEGVPAAGVAVGQRVKARVTHVDGKGLVVFDPIAGGVA
jgi:uncharacterized OB-fold protein